MSRSTTSPDAEPPERRGAETLSPPPADAPAPGEPLLVVLTGPSGTGKTTVTRRVLAEEPTLAFSVSHTTRPPRASEQDGREYHFVDDASFDRMIAEDAFAEWAWVHGRRYGTTRAEIERNRNAGYDVFFDIDTQGGLQLMRTFPEAVTVFLLPPSLAELERRLERRHTEGDADRAARLAEARAEIAEAVHYRYALVNDEVDDAVTTFRAILRAERHRTPRRRDRVEALLRARFAFEESEA